MPTNAANTKQTAVRHPVRTRQGKVVRISGPTTAIIEVESVKQHPKYRKRYTRSTTYVVHVRAGQSVTVGQTVKIAPTRPLSATKRWRLANVGESA